MARLIRIWCRLFGHKWNSHRRGNVRLLWNVCKRCKRIDSWSEYYLDTIISKASGDKNG